MKDAPKMSNYLSLESKARFKTVLEALDKLEIPYEVDDTLVRGLDYYSETVFEFHYVSEKGNNYGAIGAGGHYDKLVKEVGGPDAPGIGFSFGVERLVSVISDDGLAPEEIDPYVDIYVMPMGAQNQVEALILADQARLLGYNVDMCFDDTKLGNMFKRAEKKGAKFAVIIGDNEVKENKVIIKNLNTKEQFEISRDSYEEKIAEFLDEDDCCKNHERECCEGEECCCNKQ